MSQCWKLILHRSLTNLSKQLKNLLSMSPREALKFSIGRTVLTGLCWYFCFEVGNMILQKFDLFNIFFQQLTLVVALVFGIILGFSLIILIETIYYNIINNIINRRNQKLTQLNLKARRKYQKINHKDIILNNSINLTINQIYRTFGDFYFIDINFLRPYIVTTPIRPPGSTKYTVKCMFKDIAIIGFVSLLLHSLAILLQIHLNLLFLLVSALLTFGVAHLWVGLVWPFINWTLVKFWLTLQIAFNFFR